MTLICAYSLTETLLGLEVWDAVAKGEKGDRRTHGISLSMALRREGARRALFTFAQSPIRMQNRPNLCHDSKLRGY